MITIKKLREFSDIAAEVPSVSAACKNENISFDQLFEELELDPLTIPEAMSQILREFHPIPDAQSGCVDDTSRELHRANVSAKSTPYKRRRRGLAQSREFVKAHFKETRRERKDRTVFGRTSLPSPQAGKFTSFLEIPETARMLAEKINELDTDEVNKLFKGINDSRFLEPEVIDFIRGSMRTTRKGVHLKNRITSSFVWRHKTPMILFFIGLWALNQYRAKSEKVYLLVGLTATGYALYCIWGTLPTFKVDSKVPTPQSFVTEDGIKDLFSYLITSLLLGLSTSKDVPSKVMQGIIQLPRMGDGIDMIINNVKDISQALYDWIRKNVMSKDPKMLFESKYLETNELIMEAAEIDKLVATNRMSSTPESLTRVERCVSKLVDTLKEMPRNAKTANMCNDLFSLLTRMRKRLETLQISAAANGNIRQEPTAAMFRGDPGTFKTLIVNLLAYDLMCRTLEKEKFKELMTDPKRYIFYRRMGEKYWDTFTSDHQVTIMDDFAQATDVANGESSEFLDWIRAMNTAPYPLNMAELTSKGKAYFHSKFILATTNLKDIRPVSVVSAEAVKRRIDFLIRVIPKTQYKDDEKSAFDLNKLPRTQVESGATTKVHPRMAEYQLETWDRKPVGEPLSYEQLITLLIEKHHEKKAHFQAQEQQFRDIAQPWRDYHGLKIPCEEPDLESAQALSDLIMEKATWPEPQGFIPSFWDIDELVPLREEDSPPPGSFPIDNELPKLEGEISTLRKMVRLTKPRVRRSVEATAAKKISMSIPPNRLQNILKLMCEYDPIIDFEDRDRTLYCFVLKYGEEFVKIFEDGDPKQADVEEFCWLIANEMLVEVDDDPGIFDRIMSWWLEFSTGANQWMEENFPVLAGISDVIGTFGPLGWTVMLTTLTITVLGASKLIDMAFGWFDSLFGTQFFTEPESVHKDLNRVKIERNSQKIKMRNVPEPQLGKDPNGTDIMASVMMTNGYEVHFVSGDKQWRFGYAFAIVDRVFLMPYHFITHTDALTRNEPATIRFVRKNKGNPVVYEISSSVFVQAHVECIDLQRNDLVTVKLPNCVGQHRDIRKFFCSEQTVSRMLSNMDIMICFPDANNKSTAYVNSSFENNQKVRDIDGSMYELRKAIQYFGINTNKGDCGGLVAWANPRIQVEKIFGMHVAGDSSSASGYAGMVTREMLDKGVEDHFEFVIDDDPVPQDSTVVSDFDVIAVSVKSPRIPTKTLYTKTKLYGMFPEGIEEEPAHLHRLFSDKLDIQMSAKYGKRVQYDVDFSKESSEYYDFLISKSPNHVTPELYSFERAVLGDGEGLRSIDRSTSSGFPFNLEYFSSKKSWFFGKAADIDLHGPNSAKLKDGCEEYISSLVVGKRMPQYYSDFPKDELHGVVKARAGKIRLIAASTIIMLVVGRMYFGSFMSWFTRNAILNGSAIGNDPYSGDWTILVNCLHSKGESINSGDYKNYDADHLTCAIWVVLDIIQRWYNDSPENQKVRRGLFLEIVNSRHLYKGVVVQWNGGMPPGNFLTSIINTMANHLYIRKCFAMMFSDELCFDEHVFLVCQGDDNIWSVSDDLCDKFNEYEIIPSMKVLGLTYTTEDKAESHSYRKRTIDQCEFLKRGFVFHRDLNRWTAPLRLSKALSLCYWTKENDTQIFLDKLDVMSWELALAGEDVWNKYMPLALERWRSIKGTRGWPRYTSYEKVLGQYY